MAEKVRPPEHRGDFGDRFFLHRGRGAPAVERVIVGIDPHRQGIGEPRHRMRRLEHLSGVQWMKIRIVVVKALGCGVQHFREALRAGRDELMRGQAGESGIQLLRRA